MVQGLGFTVAQASSLPIALRPTSLPRVSFQKGTLRIRGWLDYTACGPMQFVYEIVGASFGILLRLEVFHDDGLLFATCCLF